jgi:hypothetical protein
MKDGQLAESREEIEIVPAGGAIAQKGQHSVTFAANLNTSGAISLQTPDGKLFRSHILGLAYTDGGNGNSVMIALIKDSIGQLVAPNQIIYPDAFTGFKAHARYTYTKAGLEQDIILEENPPAPADYGLNPATTRLEVYTEMLEAPAGIKETSILTRTPDPERQTMVEPDLTDDFLNFGAMHVGRGNAFPLNNPEENAAPTGKKYEIREGRQFLIERVDYSAIKGQLDLLPKTAALKQSKEELMAKVNYGNSKAVARVFPPAPPPVKADSKAKVTKVAQLARQEHGLVLDYSLLSSSSNFVFSGDSTYFVAGTVNLTGTTVLEGGVVIKSTNSNSSATRIALKGPLDCQTSAYRPAIFTGKDDNTVGETISGSTGNPTTNYYGTYLDLAGNANLIDLHDVRLRYAYYGINLDSSSDLTLSHGQIGGSYAALVNAGHARIRNVLIHDGTYAIGGTGTTNGNQGEHITFHRLNYLRSSGTTLLTNCLIISVTNNVFYTGANVLTNLDDTGFFQAVGSGIHYLANNSTNRNAGTTNINPDLLVQLRQKSTFPPLLLTNNFTLNTTLSPQAQRDTDMPDLGYHYDPLDFTFGNLQLTNATLTVTPGTALGIYGASGNPGLLLLDGGNLICEGTASDPCRVVRYNLVQEQATTNWAATSVGISIKSPPYETSPNPTARFRFTDFAMPAAGAEHFNGSFGTMPVVTFRDSQFHGGNFYTEYPGVAITNCLFERVQSSFYGVSATYRNNTFYYGLVSVDGLFGSHDFSDNVFENTTITQTATNTVTANYNGYVTNANRLSPTGAHDVVLTTTNVGFQKGWFGRFYLPTNSAFTNAGSRTADLAGLYHFTTATNNVKETNSVVDLGSHGVALNGSNQPVDTDADGWEDWYEDINNSGTVNSGETDWNSATDLGLRVQITNPRSNSNLP